jgi:hypothetical protein
MRTPFPQKLVSSPISQYFQARLDEDEGKKPPLLKSPVEILGYVGYEKARKPAGLRRWRPDDMPENR